MRLRPEEGGDGDGDRFFALVATADDDTAADVTAELLVLFLQCV